MAIQSIYSMSSLAIRTYSCCNSPLYEKSFVLKIHSWSSHSPSKGLGSKYHNYKTGSSLVLCKLIS